MRRLAVGQRARRRVRAGGPRATGRPAASLDDWRTITALVLARAGWRCQACGLGRRLDVHHVVKRAQGGSDFDLDRLMALCRACHAQTDAACATGRPVVTSLGAGRFVFEVIQGPSKWESAPVAARDAGSAAMDGQPVKDRDGLPTWAKRGFAYPAGPARPARATRDWMR